MIPPTNGRIVLFHPPAHFGCHDRKQLLAAIVVHVWNERLINLTVFDSDGVPHPFTSVQLLQDDDAPTRDSWAEWMPYQKGQAAKTEQLEQQVEKER